MSFQRKRARERVRESAGDAVMANVPKASGSRLITVEFFFFWFVNFKNQTTF